MKMLRIKLPDSLHARLKVQAAMDGVSMQHMALAGINIMVDTSVLAHSTQINPNSNMQVKGE